MRLEGKFKPHFIANGRAITRSIIWFLLIPDQLNREIEPDIQGDIREAERIIMINSYAPGARRFYAAL